MPQKFAILLALLALTNCAGDKEAAEIFNSIAHQYDLGTGEGSDLPNVLSSGGCTNEISNGNATLSYGVLAGTLIGAFTIAMDLGSSTCTGDSCNRFECTAIAQYTLSADQRRLVDGGTVLSCEGFSCTIRGRTISCEDFKKALREHTCSDTNKI